MITTPQRSRNEAGCDYGVSTKAGRWFWASLGNLAIIVGWIASFALPAWAVAATETIFANQPLSWVVAGFLGVLSAAVITLVAGAGRNLWVTAGVRNRFYRQNDRFNPMESVFQQQRIAIADLVNPLEQVVKNKKFIGCEIVGPANIVPFLNTRGSSRFSGNNFAMCDVIEIGEGVVPQNAIGFVDCDFEDCQFYKVNLLFQSQAVSLADSMIKDLQWITPREPKLLTLTADTAQATNEGNVQPDTRNVPRNGPGNISDEEL